MWNEVCTGIGLKSCVRLGSCCFTFSDRFYRSGVWRDLNKQIPVGWQCFSPVCLNFWPDKEQTSPKRKTLFARRIQVAAPIPGLVVVNGDGSTSNINGWKHHLRYISTTPPPRWTRCSFSIKNFGTAWWVKCIKYSKLLLLSQIFNLILLISLGTSLETIFK